MSFSIQCYLYENVIFADNVIDENDDKESVKRKNNIPKMGRTKRLMSILKKENVIPDYADSLASNGMYFLSLYFFFFLTYCIP